MEIVLPHRLVPYFNNKELSGAWWDRLNKIEDKDYVGYIVIRMFTTLPTARTKASN